MTQLTMSQAKQQSVAADTISAIDTVVDRPNPDKVVITHTREYTPTHGDTYTDWVRTDTYVRNDGNIVWHQKTRTYDFTIEDMRTKDDYRHTFPLADDNETVVHDGRVWDKYAIERSCELVNIRWKALREY